MPKFDLDHLFQYLVVIAVVVGPILAKVTKKLITHFSPKPPELPGLSKSPAQSTMNLPEARRRTAHPVTPIELPPVPTAPIARPASPPVQVPLQEQPAVGQPTPIARRVVYGRDSAIDAARRAATPVTLEAMVEEHLGHLTSNVEREAERIDRGVKRRLQPVETQFASPQEEPDRPVARKTVPGTAPASTSVRRLTRQGLRTAILLREILGPPVALRAPDEPW